MSHSQFAEDTHEWELPNFSMSEVACTCPECLKMSEKGFSFMSYRFMILVQRSRNHLGRPIYFNSGCRCVSHNRTVGGTPQSSHLFTIGTPERHILATAGDLSVVHPAVHRRMTSAEQSSLRTSLYEGGLRRFGRSDWFIHTDCDPRKTPNVEWFYREGRS